MKSCLYQERQTENNWGAKDKTGDQQGSSSPNLLSRKVNRNCDKKHYPIPDSKLVYRWPGACQMRCTWWWGRTYRPPDKAGPWPVWAAVISSSSQHEGDITCTLRRTRLREANAARARPWRWGAWWGRPGGQTPPSWLSECSCKIKKNLILKLDLEFSEILLWLGIDHGLI